MDRESVAATDTDFSSLVTNVSSEAQVVVFATQTASAANTLARQLREQGKRAVVLGTDGAYSPTQYKPRIGYVSSFATDLRLVQGSAALVRAYNRFSNNKAFERSTAELHGDLGPADGSQRGVRRRQRNPRRGPRERSSDALALDPGRHNPFTKKGDLIGARVYVFKVDRAHAHG